MQDEFVLDTDGPRLRRRDPRAEGARRVARRLRRGPPRVRGAARRPGLVAGALREGDPGSGMGGGIGQWLLFRAGDRSLTLFALVVPSGAQTPVHDHSMGAGRALRGTQDEEICGGN